MAPVSKIEVELQAVVGAAAMPLSRFLALPRGSVIPLGCDPSEPISVEANGRPIARAKVRLAGEKVVIEIVETAAGG